MQVKGIQRNEINSIKGKQQKYNLRCSNIILNPVVFSFYYLETYYKIVFKIN
jgi:hypothetical protein